MNDFDDAKVVTPEAVQMDYGDGVDDRNQIIEASAINSITRAEIDVQIATAHKFRRSVAAFKEQALAMATLDEETAASCFYKIPRGGKVIEGPSVRLAEIIGSCWGNMRYGSRIVDEERDYVTAQGVAHDLEKNVSVTIEVRRRITDKRGKRYNADMIQVTANAACSISLRNAIFKVIPKAFANSIYDAAKLVAIGDATTLVERRTKAIDYFTKMGVMPERVFAVLGKDGIEDVNLEDLELLTGLKTAIKDGDTTVDQAFPPLEVKKNYKGSDKAVEPKAAPVNTDTGEVKESEPKPAKKAKSKPEPKTPGQFIGAIQDRAVVYGWSDGLLLNIARHITKQTDIEGLDELARPELEMLYDTLSDEDATLKAIEDYEASLEKGDDLFKDKQ